MLDNEMTNIKQIPEEIKCNYHNTCSSRKLLDHKYKSYAPTNDNGSITNDQITEK